MVRALDEDPTSTIEGYAADSGEGRWTVNAAVFGAPVPTMAAALFARFTSQQEDSPSMKMVAAMRNQFGGHAAEGRRRQVDRAGRDLGWSSVSRPRLVAAERGRPLSRLLDWLG